MKRLVYALLAVCMSVFSAVGAGTESASTVLNRTTEAIQKAGGICATFTMTLDGHSSEGEIILYGDKFKISSSQMSVWYDGRTQWAYNPDIREVNITEPTPEELIETNPFVIISSFKNNYTSKLLDSPKGTYRVDLKPRQNAGQTVSRAILTIDTSTYLPVAIAVTIDGGQTMAIHIKSLSKGKNYPQSTFVFNKKTFPKAEIVDLR
ncbi:MAG: outer-membrane lipoprotein carrier protein LolA [Muribaculum sp.]|nr:outer-membrane lipoprotein carrier protein LolA [Muribaculum sp.]